MVKIKCSVCHKSFKSYPSRIGRKKYCSKKCFYNRRETKGEIEKRFWDKVRKTRSCWFRYGKAGIDRYSSIRIGKETIPAHRYSYELHIGKIPNGKFVLHKCDVMPCVNPRHLFIGTNLDNMRDMIKKGRKTKLCGVDNPMAKLNPHDAFEIRRLRTAGVPVSEISKRVSISQSHIYEILNGKYWS